MSLSAQRLITGPRSTALGAFGIIRARRRKYAMTDSGQVDTTLSDRAKAARRERADQVLPTDYHDARLGHWPAGRLQTERQVWLYLQQESPEAVRQIIEGMAQHLVAEFEVNSVEPYTDANASLLIETLRAVLPKEIGEALQVAIAQLMWRHPDLYSHYHDAVTHVYVEGVERKK
jgi:hypothetical protein